MCLFEPWMLKNKSSRTPTCSGTLSPWDQRPPTRCRFCFLTGALQTVTGTWMAMAHTLSKWSMPRATQSTVRYAITLRPGPLCSQVLGPLFQFHYKTDQGIKNFTRQEADEMASKDPDYSIRDLYNAISNGQFPSWTMHVQVMTYEQVMIDLLWWETCRIWFMDTSAGY